MQQNILLMKAELMKPLEAVEGQAVELLGQPNHLLRQHIRQMPTSSYYHSDQLSLEYNLPSAELCSALRMQKCWMWQVLKFVVFPAHRRNICLLPAHLHNLQRRQCCL